MRTPEQVANQILNAMGITVQMKNHNKAFHDRMQTVNILEGWLKEIIFNTDNSLKEKGDYLKHD